MSDNAVATSPLNEGDLIRLVSRHIAAVAVTGGMQAALRHAWQSFKMAGWDFALLAAEAQATAEFLAWGYSSLGAWATGELGFDSASTMYRYAKAGAFLRSLDDAETQQRWLSQPIYHAIEALPLLKHEPDKALAIVEAAQTVRQVRQAVQAADPDQHHDTSGWRTVQAKITEDTLHEWQRAVNVVRAICGDGGVKYPTDDDVMRIVAQTVLQAPELAINEAYRADVEAGSARCHYPVNIALRYECGAYAQLERHHVVPRSHQGHEGPLVWLCHTHHQAITENKRGFGWRELAQYLGIEAP